MRVTSVGHAGLFVETAGGTILCDPWLNPAYFASWFVFPDNSELDWERLGRCDYLYVSHLHHDHFDPENLRRHVDKRATVLLPEFPVDDLEVALRSLGFTRFAAVPNDVPVELDGLRVMISALVAPSDGPLGDSALAADDGTAAILNQNDARPFDFTSLLSFVDGRGYDGHFLQFSGAIWYPMVYDFPEATKAKIAAQKRSNGMERALRYVEQVGSAFVFPTAGPPCFLDDELRHLNDVDRDEANIFPDQTAFLDFMAERGRDHGRLLIPGSTAELASGGCSVSHPLGDDEVAAIFTDKSAYLDAYAGRQRERIAAEKASWAVPGLDVLAELQSRMDPLLDLADTFRAAVGYPVEVLVLADPSAVAGSPRADDLSVVIDFPEGVVRLGRDGERCRYRFRVARPLIERLLADGEVDWSNSLFLSMRFVAHRAGAYNEHVYTWFKCQAVDRLEYAEGWYAELEDSDEETVLGEWCVQRRCPHMKADLSHFGVVEGTTLTCRMHGWQWDLDTGRCLTSAGHPLRTRPAAVPLAGLTSLRVGGPAGRLRKAANRAEIVAALRDIPERDAASLLVLGGGTNVVISDEGFPGTVLVIEGGDVESRPVGDAEVEFVVDAGVDWDGFVAQAVGAGCRGVEMLSGIPGRVGAAPLQNIAAYGQQVCDVIEAVGVIDRETLEERELGVDECGFGFRTSRFKREWRDRFVVTHVRFRLPLAAASPAEPSTYVDVERYFERTGLPPTDITARRRAVLEIRRSKSMVLDPADPMTRSVGSFFVNPEVPVELARALTERFRTMGLRVQYLEGRSKVTPDGSRQRIPAAHLLRFSGFRPGDRWGPVGLSERHVLALVTYDGATASDVWQVANFLRERVLAATGVSLDNEAVFIGDFPEFDVDAFLVRYEYRRASAEEPEWLAGYRSPQVTTTAPTS
ncbi:MAG: UDP-MurNAc hydroxylase [Actinomycetota bacterium]|nr:UDP-MurNAc hydroxylase [Actinomycetota bacterium]